MIDHVPDKLAEILFNPLVQGAIKLSCCIIGQSRPTIEGTGCKVVVLRYHAYMKSMC